LKTAGASGPAETNHAILAQKIRRCVETKELCGGDPEARLANDC